MQYLIINQTLDAFACADGRVLMSQQADFNADFLATLNNQNTVNKETNLQILQITDNVTAIVSEDLTILTLQKSPVLEFIAFRQLIADYNSDTVNLFSKAIQLMRWRQDHHFCSRCGTKTVLHATEHASVCENCQYHQYPRIQPCIITAVVKRAPNQPPKILLAHHQRAKQSGMYTLIAGFVEVGESLEQCVHREVAEEVDLQVTNLRYIASQPWAFPSNLMMGFIADYESGEIKIQEDELIHADFFDLDNLPKIPTQGTIAHDLIMAIVAEFKR